jgi:hypothetical protein
MPIAKWDGNDWLPLDTTTMVTHPLGGSLKPHIDDMIAFDNKIFIIGNFRYDDPIFPFSNTFEYFAYYDSSGWHSACSNLTNHLYPLDAKLNVFNSELYISGCNFYDTCITGTSSGIMTARGLARYNAQCKSVDYVGNGWGLILTTDMVNFNGSMYIGLTGIHPSYGSFITRFDGTDFYPVGSGLNAEVYALATYNGQLAAGGLFTSDGLNTQSLKQAATWDGTQWNTIPSNCLENHSVYYLNVLDTLLISSGNADSCGIVQASKSLIYPSGLTTVNEMSFPNSSINLFPNPSNGDCVIQITNPNNIYSTLLIHDLVGKLVYEEIVQPISSQINLKLHETIGSGIYTISLIPGTRQSRIKMIIAK